MTSTGSSSDRDPASEALQRELRAVMERIAAHPLNSDAYNEARRVAAEDRDADAQAVNEVLREKGLPTLGAQTRMLLLGTASLARLHRRRLRLQQRLDERGLS